MVDFSVENCSVVQGRKAEGRFSSFTKSVKQENRPPANWFQCQGHFADSFQNFDLNNMSP